MRNRPGRALESQDWGLNYGVREDMLSEARSLAQTYPILRRINRQYANRCVGSMRMKWQTGDTDIDRIFADAWQSWMRIADFKGRHHFRKLTKTAVQSVIRDGRVYGGLDRRNGFLQIDGIEGDRVSSDGIFNADRQGLVAGHLLDGNGRTRAIKVWERTLYGTFCNPVEIPINQFVHVFDTDRFDAVTGVTAYHTVLNTVRDLKETIDAERGASKRNSKIALLVKSMTGGATGPLVNLFDGDSNASTVSGGAPARVGVEKAGDVATVYNFPGEEIKAHTSERPSEGWRWFMEWLVREMATGLDLPFGVVWHMAGLGGPAVRFEMGQANSTFMAFLEDILEPMWTRPIVGAWLTLEIASGRLPFHPNWYRFQVPRPASITIDLGRDSKAGISENAAGLLTATDWYAEDDKDFEAETEQLAKEAQFRRKMADKYGVTVEEIRALGTVTTKIDTSDKEDEEPDEEEPQPARRR